MTKQLSTVAQAAKQIRQIIKKELPSVKFRVRSENYSMGDSINVYIGERVLTTNEHGHEIWKNELAEKVKPLIKHYQYGHFDGMNDIYEHSNSRDDIPQTKFLFVEPLANAA